MTIQLKNKIKTYIDVSYDKKVETQIIDNSNVSSTEVFPIEDNDWN